MFNRAAEVSGFSAEAVFCADVLIVTCFRLSRDNWSSLDERVKRYGMRHAG
jgi:hypothetical protein